MTEEKNQTITFVLCCAFALQVMAKNMRFHFHKEGALFSYNLPPSCFFCLKSDTPQYFLFFYQSK
jgi:hypothetical protein